MAKLIRKTASIFCGSLSAGSQEVEQFGSKVVVGTPNYTVDPAVIQALAAWGDGWGPALNATNDSEYKQDRNGVDLVASYQLAYLLQQGVAEYDAATTYYTDSVVQFGGLFYISRIDANVGNQPDTHAADWRNMSAQPTTTVLTAGAGNYTPPVGCVMIKVRMVGGGGGASGAGAATTFGTFTAGAGAAGPAGAGGVSTGGSVNVAGAVGSTTGGASAFGGAGSSTASAAANSGSGANGGGAGGYLEGEVANPGVTAYSVGAGGAGAQAGGSGQIVIQEFFY